METEILNSRCSGGATYIEFFRDNLSDFLEDMPILERNTIVFQQHGSTTGFSTTGSNNARIVTD